jgi:4-hydroxy-2-oxoheptanedioate aldolase
MTASDYLGCFCALGAPLVAELVARSGVFGWICIDLQHGMGGFTECLAALQAIRDVRTPVLVRTPPSDYSMMSRVLDAGANGILIANVDTPEQARRASAATYYPPRGARSIGATRARFLQADYVAEASAGIECVVMLESPQAFESLDEIAREPISGLFVGLADLALTLGHPTRDLLDDPRIRGWLQEVLKTCRSQDLTSGAFSEDPSMAVQLKQMGFDRIAIGLDVSLLIGGARQLRAAFDSAWAAS